MSQMVTRSTRHLTVCVWGGGILLKTKAKQPRGNKEQPCPELGQDIEAVDISVETAPGCRGLPTNSSKHSGIKNGDLR